MRPVIRYVMRGVVFLDKHRQSAAIAREPKKCYVYVYGDHSQMDVYNFLNLMITQWIHFYSQILKVLPTIK